MPFSHLKGSFMDCVYEHNDKENILT